MRRPQQCAVRHTQFEIAREAAQEELPNIVQYLLYHAAMTDPFLQRMMARSQARRAAVANILGNKENVGVSDTTRSRLTHLSTLHTETSRDATPFQPLQLSNDNFESSIDCPAPRKTNGSPEKDLQQQPTDSGLQQPDQPTESQRPPSPHKTRLPSLARRCQEINNWDDDYTYHSSSHGSQVAVAGNFDSSHAQFDMHDACSLPASNHNPAVSMEEPRIGNTNALINPCVTPSPVTSGIVFSGGAEFSPSVSGTQSQVTKASSSIHITQHPKPHSKPQTPNKTVLSPSANASPTKKLVWDRGLINSLVNLNDGLQDVLEAQGFTPSDSRSKLYYDFKKEQQRNANERKKCSPKPSQVKEISQPTAIPQPPASPSKVRSLSLAEFVRSASPQKIIQVTDQDIPASACLPVSQASNTSLPAPPPPVVVSCLPKSPVSSPAHKLARVPSPEPELVKERVRHVSPSKVGEMRSRWEQHIRQASPERSDRSRSPRKPDSPRKMKSAHSSGQVNSGNTESHHPPGSSRSPTRSPHKHNQSGFNRFTSERKSWREMTPFTPTGEIVKGEAPMPQVTPLVEEPFSSSVRERAAAFDGARKQEPQKDPAEMSLQERLAIFSKKQGGALVPKAPFGQPVPAKALHGDGGSALSETGSRPSVAHSQPVQRPAKRVAAEPGSSLSHSNQINQQSNRSTSPVRNRTAVFEHMQDNWQENEINTKMQNERQQEMEVLLNRFKKPKQVPAVDSTKSRFQNINERPRYPEESESEYLESDESITESSTSDDTSQYMQGPPKPPRLFREPASKATHTQDGLVKHSQLSPPKVLSSPKKEFVPKVKPGRIYPSLTDIESHSEAPDSQDEEVKDSRYVDVKTYQEVCSSKKKHVPRKKQSCLYPSLSDAESHSEAPCSQDEETPDSSFAESVLTCTSIESLGQKIQKAANTSTKKPLAMISENTTLSQTNVNSIMSESTMEALEAIDDAIEEALDDDLSPTPPKRHCSHDEVSQCVFKTPKINDTPPRHCVEEQDASLAHTISMYRKQRPEVTYTPVRPIIRRPELQCPSPEPVSPSVTVSARIKELQEEVLEQQRVIAQASNAVSVVLQRQEQQGTPQHVEAEKLLLLASQKRQSALNEIQRLKAEGSLGHQNWSDVDTCMGSISISNISVPLKHEFLQRGMNGEDLYHLIVLVKHREQVISSQLMTTPECVVEGAVTFPNLMALHHLTSDFNITLEVYALCTQEPQQINFKKEHSRLKLTPLKRLQKHDSRTASPAVHSPGGPFAVRTSAFQLVGFTHLNISTLARNAWTLEKVPFSSPLDGHLLMHVNCSFEGGITERGFLTMFEDVGGFGAWNRRWCVLSGMNLRYWRYPDDEIRKEASGQLDLRFCTTRRVELVSRDICARHHTFQLTFLRPANQRDVTNLVQEVKGSTVVTKMLLSSDSKEERVVWCNKLNKALANIRAWDPDAMRPEDYQV